jgi:SNF2 family DNA or RNA helicase
MTVHENNVDVAFDKILTKRMERYNILLLKSKFQFKQYQYDGVKWCLNNEIQPKSSGRGGFIADEMGLGKTIMMIGLMVVNYVQHTLIVVPPVLIHQWFKEIYKTTGHKSMLFYGDNKKTYTQEDINKAHIVLTTYNMLLPEKCLLKNILWNRVIFDEAHHLRNYNTRRYKACLKIKSPIRWLVTGTPIQNKKQDFKNLCCIAGIKPTIYTNPKEINNFVLRRTKLQVGINLPPVNKQECLIEWQNPKEMKLAEEIHSLLPNQTFVSISKQRKLAQAFGKAGILVALLRARQSCILPNLMRKNMELLCKSGCIRTESLEALKYTSKLDAVIKLMLDRKDNGKGKIVFCHYQSEIDVIAERLLKGGMTKVVCYDGRNSGGHNLTTLSEPADALIIQIQTGCEGLNLQLNFSEIYFISPHWNPCVEDQAIARCHRIGQTKPVDVFKFEMRGFINDSTSQSITLEKYVNQVQDIKRDISKQILETS